MDPERTGSYCFFTDPDRIQFHYKMQTRTISEFGFAPQIIWGQNQHYISRRLFFVWSPPEFWQKKFPNFQLRLFYFLVSTWILAEKTPLFLEKTFFLLFGIQLNLGRKNALVFSEDLFFGLHLYLGRKNASILSEDLFRLSLVYFWFLLLWTKCNCILADLDRIRILNFKRWPIRISSSWIRIGSRSLNLWILPTLICYCSWTVEFILH